MIDSTFYTLIFWGSLGTLAFTFLGYPALMACLARLAPRPTLPAAEPDSPKVSVVLCVFNEEDRIESRVHNLLNSSYPPNNIEVLVCSDGSTDGTVARARGINAERVRVLAESVRQGKAEALNRGVEQATGKIVVFADARQRFAPDTLARLVAHFQDPQVGAVSGSLEIDPSSSAVGGGIDAYWRLEKLLRNAESRWGSVVGCTGAVYAIRKELYPPIPSDTILDDVVIPMHIAQHGWRVLFEPTARAFDPQPLEPHLERIRKQRTLAGNLQMLVRYPSWILPWGHRLWWQLIAHKYLRLLGPFFLISLLVANASLLTVPFYKALFLGQCLFYGCAGIGSLKGSRRHPLFSLPAGFVFLNWLALAGCWQFLRGTHRQGWQMTRG